jgi:hypothetical protein
VGIGECNDGVALSKLSPRGLDVQSIEVVDRLFCLDCDALFSIYVMMEKVTFII